MEADGVVTLTEAPPAPAGVRFVPGEDVLLLAVAMPEMSAAQRRAAVGFAVEDMIARPLDEAHVVLGPAIADRWLVAVIGRDVLGALPAAGKARLVPDVLAVPVPETGQWSVWAGPSRVLVRTADGAGFATAAGTLPYYHLAAGRPGIVLYGGVLDAQFPVLRQAILPMQLEASLQRFDLNTGGAGRGLGLPRAWRQVAAVLALAGLGHLGLLVTDTLALGHIRDDSAQRLRDALGAMGQPAGDDLDAAISAVLAQANGGGGPKLIPLMARVFGALGGHAGAVTTSDLRYGADQNSLTLTLQAPDIATLQEVETALIAAGFAVTAGAATTGNGLAEQQLTLLGGGA